MNPALKLASALICVTLTASLQQAFAEDFDIALYGGTTFNNQDLPFNGSSTRRNSVSVSAGVRAPTLLGQYAKLRGDISYLFGEYKARYVTAVPSNPGQIDFYEPTVDRNAIMFHVGPVWDTRELLGRFTLSAGAQVGLTHSRTEFPEATLYGAVHSAGGGPSEGYFAFNVGGKSSSTDFSYQFPVGVDFAISDRLSIGARYRAVHTSNGAREFEHVAEGGIRFKF